MLHRDGLPHMPLRSALQERVVRDRKRDRVRATGIEKLCDRLFRRARRGKAPVEDVALAVECGSRCSDPHRDARHRIGEMESFEIRADETEPCRTIRRRMGRPNRVIDHRSIGERELERENPGALASCVERIAHMGDEPMDHEQHALPIAESVLRPGTRCPWQDTRKCPERTPPIFRPREPPEADAIRATAHFDFLSSEHGEISTRLDAQTGEQWKKCRIRIGHIAQDRQWIRSEELAIAPRRHDGKSLMPSGDLRCDRRPRDTSLYATRTVLPDDSTQRLGHSTLRQSPCIGPNQPARRDSDPRRDPEQRFDQTIRRWCDTIRRRLSLSCP
jgi:hypothetical protein